MQRLAGAAGLCLVLALGGCQSIQSIQSIFDDEPAPETESLAAAQPDQQAAGEGAAADQGEPTQAAGAAAQSGQGGGATTADGGQAPTAPAGEAQTAATAAPGQIPQTQAGLAQGSLADAARASGAAGDGTEQTAASDNTRTISIEPGSGGLGSNISRRFDSLFGSGSVPAFAESEIGEDDVVGRWQINEEDGLRVCALALSEKSEGSKVVAGPDCTGLAAAARGWGLFGADLLLHDSGNTVIARLRRSGNAWVGFTLETGIPVVLSRAGG